MRLLFYGVFALSICLERQDQHLSRQSLDLLNCLRQKYAFHSLDQASRAGYFAKMNKMGKPCPSPCDEPSYVDTRHHWTSCRRHRSQPYYICQSLDLVKRLPSDIRKFPPSSVFTLIRSCIYGSSMSTSPSSSRLICRSASSLSIDISIENLSLPVK